MLEVEFHSAILAILRRVMGSLQVKDKRERPTEVTLRLLWLSNIVTLVLFSTCLYDAIDMKLIPACSNLFSELSERGSMGISWLGICPSERMMLPSRFQPARP